LTATSNLRLLNIRERQLTGAWLDGANLSGARLDEANLSGAFGKADLSSAQLTRANLSGSPARLGELVFAPGSLRRWTAQACRSTRQGHGSQAQIKTLGRVTGIDRRQRSWRWALVLVAD
jgi:uncharacterized protein YjbI with pentapeptide repeats